MEMDKSHLCSSYKTILKCSYIKGTVHSKKKKKEKNLYFCLDGMLLYGKAA